MREFTNERDFCIYLHGMIYGRTMDRDLANDALVCWRKAGGPREGRGSRVGQILARIGGGELAHEEGSIDLRTALIERLDQLEPGEPVAAIRDATIRLGARLAGRGVMMDDQIRELDAMLKILQIRQYLTLEGLDLRALVDRVLSRVEQEEQIYDADAAEHERAQLLAFRDRAYAERNTLAVVVARCIQEHGGRAGTWIDQEGEPGFQVVVGFDLPSGQVTFHMDERDPARPWELLPSYRPARLGEEAESPYDGHTDHEKWERIRAFLESDLGALRVFAQGQLCAAGFGLWERDHAPSDVPCAHYPGREEREKPRFSEAVDREGRPTSIEVLEDSAAKTSIRATFSPVQAPERP